ncbi:MAG: OmpH family outer membrane protein [Acidobacteria bacterium]|nr:OmpH family outer membrane protein [Acidobacteriota bacterium]
MKPFRTIAAATFFATIASVFTANAQQPTGRQAAGGAPPVAARPAAAPGGPIADGKIAIIDTAAFADPKQGVTRLVRVFDSVEREFKPRRDELQQLRTRYEQIVKDIDATKAVSDEKSLMAKADQAEILKKDIERKQEDGQRALDKRIKELTEPIYQDISTALQAYAKQRGVTVLFDASKMAGVMFVVNDTIDITDGFIAEYNQRNPATAAATPRP